MATEHINTIIEGRELSVPAHLMPQVKAKPTYDELVKALAVAYVVMDGQSVSLNKLNGYYDDKGWNRLLDATNLVDDTLDAAGIRHADRFPLAKAGAA